MRDSFTEGFCLELEGLIPKEQIEAVRDALNFYILNYDIQPAEEIRTDNEEITRRKTLPEEYYLYMAAKEQDGKMCDGTKRQYAMCIEKFLYMYDIPLNEININHLRMYISRISVNEETGKRLSTASINQRKAILRSFFSWLYEEEYIEKDPSVRIRPERENSRPRTAYEDVQIEALRLACQTERDRAIIDVLLSSGIRISECVGLNIDDVDFERREIVVYGKGGKWRTSYLDAAAIVSLKRYLNTRDDENEALFVSKVRPHDRLTTAGVRHRLHILSGLADVDDVIPHRFRHTMATTAINNGMPIESLQTILGHSEIETTMMYAHVSNEKVRLDYKRYVQ